MKLLSEVGEGSRGIRELQGAVKMPPKVTAFKLSEEINKPIYFYCKCSSFNRSLDWWCQQRNTDLITQKFLIFELLMWILFVCLLTV